MERPNSKIYYGILVLIIVTTASIAFAIDLGDDSLVGERFKERHKLLSDGCIKYKPIMKHHQPELYNIRAAQNILYCQILKVGHATMLGHLMRLTNETSDKLKNIKNLEDKATWTRQVNFDPIDALSKYPRTELLSIMKNPAPMDKDGNPLFRVIVVRNPLDRIMSAYRMFSDGFIEGSKLAKMIKQNITIDERPPGHMETFLKKIQKNDHKRKKISKWKHTKPFDTACSPCFLHYDYIIHLDTLEEDLRYIYHKAGLQYQEDEFKLKFHQSIRITKNNDDQYFAALSDKMKRYLYQKYRQDFYLFGFELPEYLKKFESHSPIANES